MNRVVFDTNVWVSAYAFHGRVRPLLEAAAQKMFEVAVSPEILNETARVLKGRKFGFSHDVVDAIEGEIRDIALLCRPARTLRVVRNDPDDDRILECALESGAETVVSGDEHLLALGIFRGVRVMIPAAFLDELAGEGPKVMKPGDDKGVQETPVPYRTPKNRTRRKQRK